MPLAAALTDPGLVAGAGDIIPEPTGGYGGAVLTVLAHVVGFTFPPKSALGVGGGGGSTVWVESSTFGNRSGFMGSGLFKEGFWY